MISEAEIHAAKILIVDDQEINIDLLEHMLAAAKYTSIASTTDPYKVSELHRRNHYDLILLDLKMAGMDGFQVLEALKEIETDSYLPVLVVTANPDCKLRALQSGAKTSSVNRLTWRRCSHEFAIFWRSACCTSGRAVMPVPRNSGRCMTH